MSESMKHRAKIIGALRERPMTCDELEIELQLPHQTVSARVSELLGTKAIVTTGKTRFTRAGRPANIYVVPVSDTAPGALVLNPSAHQIEAAVENADEALRAENRRGPVVGIEFALRMLYRNMTAVLYQSMPFGNEDGDAALWHARFSHGVDVQSIHNFDTIDDLVEELMDCAIGDGADAPVIQLGTRGVGQLRDIETANWNYTYWVLIDNVKLGPAYFNDISGAYCSELHVKDFYADVPTHAPLWLPIDPCYLDYKGRISKADISFAIDVDDTTSTLETDAEDAVMSYVNSTSTPEEVRAIEPARLIELYVEQCHALAPSIDNRIEFVITEAIEQVKRRNK